MSLEISGRLIQILPEQNGQGKNGTWRKQEFVLETQEQYPKKVCLNVWGDKVDILNKYAEGEMLKVAFNLESREWNGKWYTDVKAWRIDKATPEDIANQNASSVGSSSNNANNNNNSAPSYTASTPPAENRQPTPMPEEFSQVADNEPTNDLPF